MGVGILFIHSFIHHLFITLKELEVMLTLIEKIFQYCIKLILDFMRGLEQGW